METIRRNVIAQTKISQTTTLETDMSYNTKGGLTCDMVRGCAGTVTHIENKGYVYCRTHASQRRGFNPHLRLLTPKELEQLKAGTPLAAY